MNAEFKLNGKTIETGRLLLRPFEPADLEDFYEYASVEGVGEMAGWKHHQSREESQEILDRFIAEDKTFAIVLKDAGREGGGAAAGNPDGRGKVIGSLGIELYAREEALTEFAEYKGREIGYALGKAYWGRGLMTEAVQAVIDYLFGECGMDFLLCGYFDNNSRSRRVQEKCGFRPYRKLVYDTRMGTKEPGRMNLLTNPAREIRFEFSHPETLIRETDEE